MEGIETSRSEEFSNKKPLPPIGKAEEGTNSDSQTSVKSKQEDDARSNTSNSGIDRPGEGSTYPRAIRGFRPEAMSDDGTDDEQLQRSVSFSNNLPTTTRRRAFDGRETTFVTLETQTDWDWVEKVEQTGTARIIDTETVTPPAVEKEKSSVTPRSTSSKIDSQEEKPVPDASQLQMPYSDEYGIPILDLSSDTDDSSDEEITHKKMKDDRQFLPSVGPPNILQYQRESEKQELSVEEPEARMSNLKSYDLDESGIPHGMYSGKCEFCKKDIKPFPTVEQQQKYPPESLYCCNDYREFVEYVVSTTTEMEEEQQKKNKLISIKPHEHVGSKQERNAAKEKAVQRMRERELLRKQQEATGMQQNFFALALGGTSKAAFIRAAGGIGNVTMKDMYEVSTVVTKEAFRSVKLDPNELEYECFPGCPVAAAKLRPLGQRYQSKHNWSGSEVDKGEWRGDSDIYEHVPKHSKQCDAYRAAQYAAAFLAKCREYELVARQMKTINYQLSSQKCLEEGWTLRAPSPMVDEEGDDVFVPEPLHPQMMEDGKVGHNFVFRPVTSEKSDDRRTMAYRPESSASLSRLRNRPLIEKFYDSGKKFLTMFPDGTGNVFYPSGNLAILISAVKLGQYYYTIHQDVKRSWVVAAFEPNGYGYCYYPNGDIRLYIDQYGGIELDSNGGKKRKWSWKDQVTHVHAPPFQPICIGINKNIGLRVMSQDNITLTFSSNRRGCRFNMGSKLKLVAPENAPLKEVQEEYIFLEEKKNHVESILDKITNLLKFPNHPKLDKMLPPLHVTTKMNKTEKMKKDRKVFLAQQAAREKRQNPVAVN